MLLTSTDKINDKNISEFRFSSLTAGYINLDGECWHQLSAELQNMLAMRKAHLLSQFIFSGAAAIKPFPLDNNELNPLWLHGDCCGGGSSYSTQSMIISGAVPRPIVHRDEIAGYIYEDEYAVYCNLSGITAANLNASPSEQTSAVLEIIELLLNRNGFQFNNIVRTWFFLDRLLAWYREFNEIRTAFYGERGIFDNVIPASTGIGAANQYDAAVICNVFAVKPKNHNMKIAAVPSPMQDSALNYHSSFSRAVEISLPSCRQLMISGTAAIDRHGHSLYQGNAEKQLDYTMQVVLALLESRGMDWSNLMRGIAYFKHYHDKILLEKYLAKHNIAEFPLAVSHSTVCRDELLFEIEIDAAAENHFQPTT